MLRERLSEALRQAIRAKEPRRVSTLRLILATLKDRDIAVRGERDGGGISDEEIQKMLQTMVRQRRDSVAAYEQAGRVDLASAEQEEIEIIEGFMPRQMTDDEIAKAVSETVDELGADGLKDMGRIMGALKEKYAGRMDFKKANAKVREKLV